MKTVKQPYPFRFFSGDHEKMKAAPEDVLFEKDGRQYSQFFKGQLIPSEIYDEVFGKSEKEDSASAKSEEVAEEEEDISDSESSEEEKPKRRRHKSIIKK